MRGTGIGYFGSQRGTRWLYPSRYPGPCIRCHQTVLAGSGEYRFDGSSWVVRHPGGHCHTPGYVWYVSQNSEAWRGVRSARLEFASHRCEWSTLGVRRCGATKDLEIHHRHYRTFGAESLHDVIALCHPHHTIADQRRRAWGSWPLVGHPFWSRGGPIMPSATLAAVAAAIAWADASPPATADPTRPAAAAPAPMAPGPRCPRCGWGTHVSARFCSRCGFQLHA